MLSLVVQTKNILQGNKLKWILQMAIIFLLYGDKAWIVYCAKREDAPNWDQVWSFSLRAPCNAHHSSKLCHLFNSKFLTFLPVEGTHTQAKVELFSMYWPLLTFGKYNLTHNRAIFKNWMPRAILYCTLYSLKNISAALPLNFLSLSNSYSDQRHIIWRWLPSHTPPLEPSSNQSHWQ